MTTRTAGNYRELVHSPAELAAEHVQWAKRLKDAPGIPFGIPTVNEKVVPRWRHDERVILGEILEAAAGD